MTGRAGVHVLVAMLCTAIGLVGGWMAAGQKTGSAGAPADHAEPHEDSATHDDHDDHEDHAHADHQELSPQALANLGVTVAEVRTTAYTRARNVAATITTPARARQPMYAPLGGRIVEVHLKQHQVVPGGAIAVTLVRDALPRPNLTLTDQILKPAHEEYHSAVLEYRRVRRSAEILRVEIARIQEFAGSGSGEGVAILPRKSLIDLRYELLRSEHEIQGMEAELRRHGCTEESLEAIAAGQPAPSLGQQVWKQALEQNGLWTPAADTLFAALPAAARSLPWTVAAVGELTAAGLPVAELSAWLKSDPEVGAHFLEIAAQLQQGNSLAVVQMLHAAGAFESVVRLVVPNPEGDVDWDVRDVLVKPGQHVDSGAPLVELENLRRLLLTAEPVGSETAPVLAALRDGAEIEAVPLIPESGPALRGLRIMRVTSDADGHGAVAQLAVDNVVLQTREDPVLGKTRSWSLREGLRYFLRIPVARLSDVFVLPSAAVTEDGPDRVVFVQEGDEFKSVRVVVLHLDDEVAVLDPAKSELHSGDRVVQKGAFGLGLALKATSAGADPHAGHSH